MGHFVGNRKPTRRQQKSYSRTFEPLEPRHLLSGAPVANNDAYNVLQNTPLTVNVQAVTPSPAAFPGLAQLRAININYTAAQIVDSAPAGLLFVREGNSKVHVIDVNTGNEISSEAARASITDMSVTSDGRYVYVADYGGTNIGYGTPSAPSYVHRFDTQTKTWVVKQAPGIAYHVEAVDSDRFLLQQIDQWVNVMCNSWGATDAAPITQTSSAAFDYYGDMEYDYRSGRAIHGGSGSSSSEIHVVQLTGTTLTAAENTGTYGTAQGYGGTSVLSTDGKYFYYGSLQVNALNVRANLHVFPEAIYAGTSGLAFGNGKYYSATTGAALGQLPFATTVYGTSLQTSEIWAFDSAGKQLHDYQIPYAVLTGVLANDSDPNNVALTAALVSGPQSGQLTLNPDGSFTYTPQAGFFGSDSFTYTASDGQSNVSNPATVTLNVRATNSSPVAQPDTYTTQYQTALSVTRPPMTATNYQGITQLNTLAANYDVQQIEFASHSGLLFIRDGNSLIHVIDTYNGFEISKLKAHTAFTDFDLTPDRKYLYVADYGGTNIGYGTPSSPSYVERFDLAARTWTTKQAPAIAYRIEAVDDTRFLLLGQDQWVNLTLNDYGATTAAPISQLSSASGSFFSGDIEFDPRSSQVFYGNSGLSSNEIDAFKLVGNTFQSVAASGTYGSAQGYGPSMTLSADGKYLFYGALEVSTTSITTNLYHFSYPIIASANGIAFSNANNIYSAENGQAIGTLGYTATVMLASDDGLHLWAFDATNKMLHYYRVSPLGFGVLANDTDPEDDPLTATLVAGPSHGALTLNANGTFTYTPQSGFFGNDTFTYEAFDGGAYSAPQTVTIRVAGMPPVAQNDSYSGPGDTPLVVSAAAGVLANDTDPYPVTITAQVVAGPQHGTLSLNPDGSFTYTPSLYYHGSDSFTYQATDGVAVSNTATVSLTVTPVTHAPLGVADSYSLNEDGSLTTTAASGVLANDSDPDGGTLSASVATGPTHGALTLNSNGSFTYTPAKLYHGADSFTYNLSNATHTAGPITVTLTINHVNHAPTASDDTYAVGLTATANAASGLLANDVDVDNDPLTAVLVTNPSRGTVRLNSDGSFTYTPSSSFTTSDSFTYKAYDGKLYSNVVTVHLNALVQMTTTASTVTTMPGGAAQGSFDVTLNVTAGQQLMIAGYEVVLRSPSAGIAFVGVDAATDSPLFPGQTPQYAISATDGSLSVTDYVGMGSQPLSGGAHLFHVRYTVASNLKGTFTPTFDLNFTALADPTGNPIPLPAPAAAAITVVDGVVPTVSTVWAGGSTWSSAFLSYLSSHGLGTSGYSLGTTGTAATVLPWVNADQIAVRFSEDVAVSTGDLVVTGVNQAVYSPTSMTYNASTATAVWTFAQPLPLDNLLVNVNGSGSGAVKDRSGNPLDGALQGSASDFHEAFTVVPGDVNGSAAVNVMDVVKTRMAQFTTTTSANYSPYYDVNGSGAVDIFDTIKVRNGQFTMAPDGLPAPYAFPAASGMLAASGDNPLASSLAGLAGGAQGLAAPSLAGASPSLGAATGQIATADGPAAPTNSSSSSSPDFTVASSTSWATVDGGNSPIYSSSIDVAQEQTLASPTAQLAALDDVLSTWPK